MLIFLVFILAVNAILTILTLLSEFGSRSSFIFQRWPATVLLLALSIGANSISLGMVFGIESTWAAVYGMLLAVGLVISASPFWIFAGYRSVVIISFVVKELNRGPRAVPEILALIREKKFQKAHAKLSSLETKFPKNEAIQIAMLSLYLKTNDKQKAVRKVFLLCRIVEHPIGRGLLIEKVKKLDSAAYLNLKSQYS